MKTSTLTQNTSAADQHAGNVIYAVKIVIFTIIAILVMVLRGSSADSTRVMHSTNTFYIQLAGVGNSRSVNYESIFRQGAKLNYSFSFGYAPLHAGYSVPVSINAFTTGRQHHFEMSLALIPHVEKHSYKTKEDLDKQMYIKPGVGYRYQKSTKGLFVKALLGPQIFLDPPSYNVWSFTPKLIGPSGQVAVGFSF